MAWAFVGKAQNTSDTSLTVSKPTGTANGNTLFLVEYLFGGAKGTQPSGFTQRLDYNDTTAGVEIVVWSKTAGASEPSSYTFTGTGTPVVISCFAFSGGSETVDGSGNQNSATGVCPSISPAQSTDLLLCLSGNGAQGSSGAPTGMTSLYNNDPTSDGTMAAYQILSASGATGTKTFPGISSNAACVSICFQAAGGGNTYQGVATLGNETGSGIHAVAQETNVGIAKVGNRSGSGISVVATLSITGIATLGNKSGSGIRATATVSDVGITRIGNETGSGIKVTGLLTAVGKVTVGNRNGSGIVASSPRTIRAIVTMGNKSGSGIIASDRLKGGRKPIKHQVRASTFGVTF